jgi:starvation-inducible outer membrane lipoprotein
MNAKQIALMSSLVLTLSACAATPAPEASTTDVNTMTNVERYKAVVNANAHLKGVDVHWVNPPDDDDLDEYTDETDQDKKSNDVK